MIYHADCRDVIAALDDHSIDALVTDPPYGLNFMGREWDKALPDPQIWKDLLRVVKPGAHGVIFGAPRLYHRLACQVEDAGWEIRDCMQWLFGSGFPKGGNTTDEHGILLKPAYEPILLVRAPLRGTVAQNVLAYGTGCLNIAACRVEGIKDVPVSPRRALSEGRYGDLSKSDGTSSGFQPDTGRWPANVILDEEAGVLLDEQSGTLKSGSARAGTPRGENTIFGKATNLSGLPDLTQEQRNEREALFRREIVASKGGASRFFYCAKASRAEREAGLEHLEPETVGDGRAVAADNAYQRGKTPRRNTHTTVKPIALMRYLVRLITPENGVVLDPFAGSGTSGVACAHEGVEFVGAELDARYAEIGNARIAHARG